MDEELDRFLGNFESLQPIFEQHKVYSMEAVKMISDLHFERMGLAIGQIAMIKALLSNNNKPAEESKVQKERRIQQLVDKIRKSEGSKEGKQKSRPANPRMVKKQAVKRRKMHIGWLHRSTDDGKYKQVRIKDGGGVRVFTYSDDEITVDCLKATASKLFFPEGVSKFGALSEMHLELGNYAQENIIAFKDTDGKRCTFQDYLKSRGLIASQCYFYLMTACMGEESGDEERNASGSSDILEDSTLSTDDENALETKDIFMGVGETRLSGNFKSPMSSTPKSSQRIQAPLYVLKDVIDTTTSTDQIISTNGINITYEYVKHSSYSEEVIMKSISCTRRQCYDIASFNDPLIRDNEFEDFDPLDNGFTVVDISKNDEYFVDITCEVSREEEFKCVFPQARAESSNLILHPPSEVWGYDGNQLILGVVASCHMLANASYVWHRDGIKIKGGCKHSCLPINAPGSYCVEVHCGEDHNISESVLVCALNESSVSSKVRNEMDAPLPVVEWDEIKFSKKDVIGRGSFSVVYKGVWAGTDVAVKQVKIRNANRIRSVVETEVRLHSMVRHPNIVQIMAISFLKNSIYLISELIQGQNLDELIFDDHGDKSGSFIDSCDKHNVGKQICQAVAYLHNLKPPVVHRDIKPANVLVSKATQITKVCDMGLSRLKSAQSLSRATSQVILGTPSYMAPECLVEKKKATVHSDVWSLACTLVELFTEKDCWDQLLDDKATSRKECDDLHESDVNSLIAIMRRKEYPRSLDSVPNTVGSSFKGILVDCFHYDKDKRPCAIEIVSAFP